MTKRFCWAEARKVVQVTFKPNWRKHAKAVPFRRNDDMLSVMPAGVIIFPGSGIQQGPPLRHPDLAGPRGMARERHFHGGKVCRRNTANSEPLFPVA
jgi:hypothetical protein